MLDRRAHLRVKIKSLAAESKIIRREEARARGDNLLRESLHLHRKEIVGSTSRESLLAYGFLRGRSYVQMESRTHSPPDFDEVAKLVERFGARGREEGWANGEEYREFEIRRKEAVEVEDRRLWDWIADAHEHVDRQERPDADDDVIRSEMVVPPPFVDVGPVQELHVPLETDEVGFFARVRAILF